MTSMVLERQRPWAEPSSSVSVAPGPQSNGSATQVPLSGGHQSRWLELKLALERAEGWDFDRPSLTAVALTVNLLRALSRYPRAGEGLDIAIGEDGSIDLTSVRESEMVVVTIPPAGGRAEMAVQDWKSGEIVSPTAVASIEEIVRRLERAV